MTPATGLPALGADIQWPDAAAIAAIEGTAVPRRVSQLAQWIAGAQGSATPRPPSAPRAVVLGPATDLAAATADRHGIAYGGADVPAEPVEALAAGAALADAVADEGRDLLVVAAGGAGDTAALVIGLITGAEPVALLPRGAAAVDTEAWIGRATRLRNRARGLVRLRESPDQLLEELAEPALAFACGLLTASAARRTPVLVDGVLAAAAAVLSYDVSARAGQWWRLADTDPDPVHRHAAEFLGSPPVLDLGLARADGLAGLLAVGIVSASVAVTDHSAEDQR